MDNQYLTMFVDESGEHLQAMNENLLELENNPGDITIVHNIFRSAHTLKGMAATMGFEDLASLTHEMENVLDLVRNDKLSVTDTMTDILFQCLDSLEAMVHDITEGGDGALDVSGIVKQLQSILNGGQEEAASAHQSVQSDSKASMSGLDQYQRSVLKQSIDSGYQVFYIRVQIDETCVLKAARAYMVFDLLEQNGEIIQSQPTVEEIEQEQFEDHFSVYLISSTHADELQKQIMNISEIASAEIELIDASRLAQIEEETNKQEAAAAVEAQAVQKNDAGAANANKNMGSSKKDSGKGGAVGRTIRVDLDRLDTLMNLFSELLIDRVRLEALAEEIKRPDLTDTVEHMARVSGDLQTIVLNLRMVPVESVFNRFPRMVRDIARSLNKKVNLVVTGADTELDRTVIDEIGDPLVHLLRNSLDHGLESSSDRIKAGKDETGKIELRAFHSGNHVFIEIEDDGRGINREKVLKTAVEKRLLTLEEGQSMSDQDVYNLLFASGFSTADEISDLSGRGVGLDVVKQKINSLGGQVSVHSEPGVGTRFTVQLPLTLSIISSMLLRLGTEKYAIPISSVVETAIVTDADFRSVHGSRMLEFRDQIIPVLDLKEVFDCPDSGDGHSDELNIVVIRKGEKMAALIVDEFLGQQETVLKSLGHYLSQTFAISGATILGDGHVALIIDPNRLVK